MPIKRIMLYVISYDITDNRRRNQVAKLLEGFGERVQYSVFECLLTADQFSALLRRLVRRIDQDADSIRCYRLCAGCADETILRGRNTVVEEVDHYVL